MSREFGTEVRSVIRVCQMTPCLVEVLYSDRYCDRTLLDFASGPMSLEVATNAQSRILNARGAVVSEDLRVVHDGGCGSPEYSAPDNEDGRSPPITNSEVVQE